MTNSNLYPIGYADTGRGGSIAGQTTATGKVGWSVETGKVTSASLPPNLLVWQGLPLLATYDDLRLFDASGKLLWRRPKQRGTPVGVATDDRLYFKNPTLFMDSVDVQNTQYLKAAPFPGAMGPEVKVLSFWPRVEDWIGVTFDKPATESRLGPPDETTHESEGPSLTVVRNEYPTSYGDYLHSLHGYAMAAPLLVPGKSIVALLVKGHVLRVDVDEEKELAQFMLPVGGLVDWSVNADEVYVATGSEQQHKTLTAVSGKGETLWRWEDHSESDAWAKLSPPIRSGHRVYALTEGRVLAIEAGHLVWAHDLRDEGLRHGANVDDGSFEVKDGRLLAKGALRHGSALADGSVLVAFGRSLVHLSAKGSKLFSVDVGGEILAPPVIDGDGAVYVATATHLVKVQ